MSRVPYLISVTSHVIAAIFWLGGMLFLALVAVPGLRQGADPLTRARLLSELGRRFRNLGWVAIGVLILSGLANAIMRWGLTTLGARSFWQTGPGRLLAAKLVIVAAMLALSLIHDFVLGPCVIELSRRRPYDPRLAGFRRRITWLAPVNLLLGLAAVGVAVLLVRLV